MRMLEPMPWEELKDLSRINFNLLRMEKVKMNNNNYLPNNHKKKESKGKI